MNSVEITFLRAFKMWWSFVWRVYLLMLPLAGIMFPLMFWLLPIPKRGDPTPPAQVPLAGGKFFAIWLFFMVGGVFMQTLAIRWAMKTKWSDFKLVAVPLELEHDQ